jgi:hypothetical protein
MACEIHLGDTGTEFRITVVDCNSSAVDVSAATSKKIYLKSPSGTTTEKDADFVTDGSDGLVKYVTVDGDLSEVGTWKIQAKVVALNGSWKTELKSFKVHRNL